MTRETETLFYNIRMIVDTDVLTEPRTWLISKVNRISPNGIARITLTQDIYDQHNDYIEKDIDGNIIGMWADYYNSNIIPTSIEPEDTPTSPASCKITCSGKPQLKVGGSPKTLTVIFYDEEGNETTDYSVTGWTYTIDGQPLYNTYINISPVDGAVNKYKCTFLGDDTFIGKVINIQCISGDITASLDIEILPL